MAESTPTTVTLDTGSIKVAGFRVELRVYKRLPDDHPAYVLIGRVAAEWAQLEHTLGIIICELARAPGRSTGLDQHTCSCITAQLSTYRYRFEVILALAMRHQMPKALIKKIQSEMNRLSEASDLRARYVHDAWFVESAGGLFQFKSLTRKGKVYGFHPIEENDIERTIGMIRAGTERLLEVRDLLLARLPP